MEQRIQTFVNTGEKLLADRHPESSQIKQKITDVQDMWASVLKEVELTRGLIDMSLPYFQLIEQVIFRYILINDKSEMDHPIC